MEILEVFIFSLKLIQSYYTATQTISGEYYIFKFCSAEISRLLLIWTYVLIDIPRTIWVMIDELTAVDINNVMKSGTPFE